MRKKGYGSLKKRLFFIIFLFAILFLIIIFKLAYEQIFNIEEIKIAEKFHDGNDVLKHKRGRILTIDGEVLAYDRENYMLILDPIKLTPDKEDSVISILKKYIPSLDSEKIKRKIQKNREKKIKGLEIGYIDLEKKNKISEEISRLYGKNNNIVGSKTNFVREYINNEAFQELIGYLNTEKKGVYGIEKYYNQNLSSIDGEIEVFRKKGSSSYFNPLKGKKDKIETREGYNVVLTVDSVLQYTLDEEMNRVYGEYQAESAMGILMEVETGKILAMSSYPKSEDKKYVKNRPIIDFFEPGSIFKPITIAIGLELGAINENSTVESNGSIKIADRVIRDHDKSTYGTVTLQKLIANSGNVGMVKIAQKIDDEKFYKYLEDMGFGSQTGIDIHFEATQKLFPYNKMTSVKKANISFGQGISMTQLQILMALNTVINNGQMIKPYIVDKIQDNDGKVIKQNVPQKIKKVFSDKVSKITRELMEAVVLEGTGKAVQIPGYRIGGKTGTAQKSGAGGYKSGKYFSSFYSFFPVDNPKYAILITINEPKGSYYGASVALPSAKRVLEKLIKYKGINPQNIVNDNVLENKIFQNRDMKRNLTRLKNEFNQGFMPDLKGLTMREVLSIYPQQKYSYYKFNGNGKVVSQFPEAGTKISNTTKIIINFE